MAAFLLGWGNRVLDKENEPVHSLGFVVFLGEMIYEPVKTQNFGN